MSGAYGLSDRELERIFPGESELARLMRALDWSGTPLGRPEGWPQSLRTAISILLNSRYPMFLAWGSQLAFLYNDGYRPIFGEKHPGALGQPFAQVWQEIWEDIRPLVERALSGEATWSEDLQLFMERRGFPEEVYFTFSYSPVYGDDGAIAGMFCACTETTGEVLGKRRLQTLRDLAAVTAEARSVQAACRLSVDVLAASAADLPYALIYLLEGEGHRGRLAAFSGCPAGEAFSPYVVDIRSAGLSGWPFAAVLDGDRRILRDLDPALRLPGTPWPEPSTTAAILPLAWSGQEQPRAYLIVGASPRLPFDENYERFFDVLAGSVANVIGNAEAYEAERQRAEALAELDRAKTAFFGNVSHEFRTPLTLMLGPLEQALRADDSALTPLQRTELEVVHRNGLRLLKLVNTLLDFSRLEAGRVEASYEPTDLAACTADLASVFRSAIERAGLHLVVDCPPLPMPVYVDRDMWEKIVLNLLSNAFKFTFAGEIAVSLSWGGAHVALAVRDTGTGIPAHELPHIFERFHRIRDAHARTHEGTGIGLALVQELVRLHSGEITVASEVGVGTTFTVTVPTGTVHLPADRVGVARTLASTALRTDAYIQEALRWLPERRDAEGGIRSEEHPASDMDTALPAPHSPLPTPPARILLADDNADMRAYVQRLLSPHWEMEAVADGVQALTMVSERLPDLVLADVMMPGLDGFALLRALRADPRTATLPVLLLSARAGEEARVEGLEAGADDYLVKPFAARELLARVGAHLAMARIRREAAEQVRQSAEELAALIRHSPIAIWVAHDPACRRITGNPAAAALLGVEYTANVSQSPPEFEAVRIIHRRNGVELRPEELPLQRAIATGQPVHEPELEVVRPDGTTLFLMGDAAPLFDSHGVVRGAVATLADVTERKRAEEALRTSEQQFRMMADTAPAMLWITDPNGWCTFLSRGWYTYTGQTEATGLGFGWLEAVHPDDRNAAREAFPTANAQRQAFRLEHRLRRADDVYRWVIDTGQPRYATSGEFLGYIGAVIDITERKEAEGALRQTHTTLEQRIEERTALLALIQDVTRAANEAPTSAAALQYALDRFCAYTGWPIGHVYLAVPPDAERWAPTALWHLDAPERFTAFQQATQALECVTGEDLIGRVGASGQPEWQSAVATDPTFHRRYAAQAVGLSTGVAWPVLVGPEVAGVLEFYTPEALAPHPALLEAMTQIGIQLGRAIERERAATQAQRQQETLRQQEKLAAMSTILANVAHELNNPLTTILLQAELLGDDVRGGPLAEPVTEIAQAAARCERLVRQFLTLARQHPPERAVVALNTLVAETVELLAYPFRVDNVAVHLHLDDQLPLLWGDPHQLQQVLINLLTNAQQALRAAPGAREVTCTTQHGPAQHQITLLVADTGPGIPPALQARIFEPFFTTKPPGLGTGLGLPLCRGIVEAHGGTLDVTSTPGHGATFRITLPVGTIPAPTPTPPSADTGPAVRGHTILVVDDERSLATGLVRLLERNGHTVDTAANGRLALTMLEARAYDLILCDVRMPELDGPSLYRILERQQPHLCQRLIFLTGDTLEPATQEFLEASGAPCLTKPFPIAEVRRAIQRVLHPGYPTIPAGAPPAASAIDEG